MALNIIRRRKEKGFKDQLSFADAIGISVALIKNIERGKSRGSSVTQKILADFFNCTVDELFDPLQEIPAEVLEETPAKQTADSFSFVSSVLKRLADMPQETREEIMVRIFEEPADRKAQGVKNIEEHQSPPIKKGPRKAL